MRRKLAIGATLSVLALVGALVLVLRARTVVDEAEVIAASSYFESARTSARAHCERPSLPPSRDVLPGSEQVELEDLMDTSGRFFDCLSFEGDSVEVGEAFEATSERLPSTGGAAPPTDWSGPLARPQPRMTPVLRAVDAACVDVVRVARELAIEGGESCGPEPHPSLDSLVALSSLRDGFRVRARAAYAEGDDHRALAVLIDGMVLFQDLAAGEPTLALAVGTTYATRGLIEEMHGLLAYDLTLTTEERADLDARLRVAEEAFPRPADVLAGEARELGALLRAAGATPEAGRTLVATHAVHRELAEACPREDSWTRCWNALATIDRRPPTVPSVPEWLRAVVGDAVDRDAMRAIDQEPIRAMILSRLDEQAFVYIALRGLRPLLAVHDARADGCASVAAISPRVFDAPALGGRYAVRAVGAGRLVVEVLAEDMALPVFVTPCPALERAPASEPARIEDSEGSQSEEP